MRPYSEESTKKLSSSHLVTLVKFFFFFILFAYPTFCCNKLVANRAVFLRLS